MQAPKPKPVAKPAPKPAPPKSAAPAAAMVAAKPAKIQPTGHAADVEAGESKSSTQTEPQGKRPRIVLTIILLIVLTCMAAVGVALYFVLRDSSTAAGRRLLLLR